MIEMKGDFTINLAGRQLKIISLAFLQKMCDDPIREGS
jgi:hypothetical protein